MKVNVVLCYPLIPQNTGSIARTCAATNSPLHLVKPLGFELSDRAMKRAGLDYWPHVKVLVHSSFNEFLQYTGRSPGRLLAFSPRGTVHFQSFSYTDNDYLLHGSETEGLPCELLSLADSILYIPIRSEGVRSLNLAVSASLSAYEALRS